MKGIIYKATSTNGKVYIGQTTKGLGARRIRHFNAALNKNSKAYNTKFSRTLRKYRDDLVWETLYKNIPEEHIDIMEVIIIGWYNSYEAGYNSTLGGEGHKVRALSDKHKKKISESLKGRMRSKETREKISKSLKGRKFSKEAKTKMSKAASGDKNPIAKLTWSDVREIRSKYVPHKYTISTLAKEYDISRTTICKVIHNKAWIE